MLGVVPVHPLRLSALTSQRRVIARTARAAFPGLADYCLIHVATTPRTLRCIWAEDRATPFSVDMRAIVSARPIRCNDLTSTVAGVVRSGKPTLRRDIHHDEPKRPPARALAFRRLAPKSALVVPLLDKGAVLGALSLCYSHSGRTHTRRHVPLAQRLAARIAGVLLAATHATRRLHTAARDARQGASLRQRLDTRN